MSRSSPETESAMRSFDTTGTILRRVGNVLTINCEGPDVADRVVDQLRTPPAGVAPTQQEPVAWRYDWRMKMFAYDDDSGWTTTLGFKEPKGDHRNEYRNVVPLAELSQSSTDRTAPAETPAYEARELLRELFKWCCQSNDFRRDSRLARKISAFFEPPASPDTSPDREGE